MAWYAYLAYFLAGAFLVNGVPHFVHGIAGKKFPIPFGSTPRAGESSPIMNVIWGLVNFVIGYVLIFGVGHFAFGLTRAAVMTGLGALVTSLALAFYFQRVRNR